MRFAVCGCGAVGSWLALFLASQEHSFLLIDDDRLEEDNIATSAYSLQHVGALKAVVLAELLWRKAQAQATPFLSTLTDENRARLLRAGYDLILDCFDNVPARLLTRYPHTLHVGVSDGRTGAVIWDNDYTLTEGPARGEAGFCTHLAGKQIIRFTASVAANMVEHYIVIGGHLPSCVITQKGSILT